MGARLAPIMNEYCDGFLLLGARAGSPHLTLRVNGPMARKGRAAIEECILEEAQRILKRRTRKKKSP